MGEFSRLKGVRPDLGALLDIYDRRDVVGVTEVSFNVIPASLQTPDSDYARTVLATAQPTPTEEELGARVRARFEREELLERRAAVRALVGEAALRRPGVDRQALAHIAAALRQDPKRTIGIMPRDKHAPDLPGIEVNVPHELDTLMVGFADGSRAVFVEDGVRRLPTQTTEGRQIVAERLAVIGQLSEQALYGADALELVGQAFAHHGYDS